MWLGNSECGSGYALDLLSMNNQTTPSKPLDSKMRFHFLDGATTVDEMGKCSNAGVSARKSSQGQPWGPTTFVGDGMVGDNQMWGCWFQFWPKKLDDGWPESVEEQGLLSLVWRRNFRNDIWKLCYRQSRRGVSRQNSEKCKTIVCIANTFTHRRFYTDAFTHKAFTHRSFYTQKLLHTEAFTHRSFYIQKLLHTDASTQTLLHTEAFTHRHFYTQKLLHTDTSTQVHFYTQTLLHTNIFTQKHSYTQTLLHRDTFTHKSFDTQLLLHRCTCTHKHFYTQTSLHRNTPTHKHVYTQTLLHTEAFTHNHV